VRLIAAMIASAGALVPSTGTFTPGLACGTAAAVDTSAPLGHAVALGDVLWLAIYPYSQGYPTKVIVMARRRLRSAVEIRGWQCSTGRRLRFSYRENPTIQTPVARFGPWPADGMRGGYFNFWAPGKWKIVARVKGRVVASTVITTWS
jgi:hypothetical protein